MKVVLFGASGMIGSRVLTELLARGHRVQAVVRNPAKVEVHEGVTAEAGDINDVAAVAKLVSGEDAVISAYNPGSPEQLVPATRNLIEGLKMGGIQRFLMVGGAGSLEVAPGVTVLTSGHLPDEWKGIAQAHADALELLKDSDLDWTYLSPAAVIEPGERTGNFRLGTDQLIADAAGKSKISAEDYAIALVDELEKNEFVRRRFTLGY